MKTNKALSISVEVIFLPFVSETVFITYTILSLITLDIFHVNDVKDILKITELYS